MSKSTKSTTKTDKDAATLLAELMPKAAKFTDLLAEFQKAIAAQAKEDEKAGARKVKRAEKAAAKEAGVTLKSAPRTAWTAFSAGDPEPEDGGDPVPAAKDAYSEEYEAWKSIAGLESGRGANTTFASLSRTAHKGDPITADGRPDQDEGEDDEDYETRIAKWKEEMDGPKWSCSPSKHYAKLEKRYKAMAEERRSSGSSTSSKRKKVADMTEEEREEHEAAKEARKKARKAETAERNAEKKAAAAAEREAAKKLKEDAKKKVAKIAKKGKNAAVDSDDSDADAKPAAKSKPAKSAKPAKSKPAESESEAESKPAKSKSKSKPAESEAESEPEPPKKSKKAKAAAAESDSEEEKPAKKSKKAAAKSDSEDDTPVKSTKPVISLPPPPKKGKKVESDSEAESKSSKKSKKPKTMVEELEELAGEVAEPLAEVEIDGTKYLSTPDNFLFEPVTGQSGAFGAYVGQFNPSTGVINREVENPFEAVEA